MAKKLFVETTAEKYTNDLRILFNEKMPNALRKGLNDAAFLLQQEWINTIVTQLDRPRDFTKKVFVTKATIDSLRSVTFIPEIQAQYLGHLVEGVPREKGERGVTKAGALVPVNAQLDKSGNFPSPLRWLAKNVDQGAAAKKRKKKGIFVGSPFGRKPAVWERTSEGGLRLLAVFADEVSYPVRLPLIPVAERFVAEKFDSILQRNIDEFA